MSDPKEILIFGAGGHAKVVIETARAAGFCPIGLLNQSAAPRAVLDVPIIGSDDDSQRLFDQGCKIGFVGIGDNVTRARISRQLQSIGFTLPTIVHPTAVVSPSASMGVGVLVMPGAIVNSSARIGDYSIVNSGAVVEHDCHLGEACHLAPRSVMGGNCTIGPYVLFGIGATACPGAVIGNGAIVGAGSVVIGKIPANWTVVGVPASPLSRPTRRI